jgi:hypothetical protein
MKICIVDALKIVVFNFLNKKFLCDYVANILGVRKVLGGAGKYLGPPLLIGRSKIATFKFV